MHSPQLHDAYSLFLGHFTEKLRIEDVPVALRWIKVNASNFQDDYAVERVIDEAMLLAWQNLETPEVIDLFAEASLARLRSYGHDIIDLSHIDQPEGFTQELSDPRKRRAVLKSILPLVDIEKHDWFLVSDSKILRPRTEDLPWLLEELNGATTEEDQKLWLQVLASFYSPWEVDPEAFTVLYEAYEQNESVKKYYSWVFTALELDTPEANQQREAHERLIVPQKERQERLKKEVLKPAPRESVLACLGKFENGDTDSWWRVNLDLGLRPYGNKQYVDELQFDLRKLPGWEEADAPTKERIVEAAKGYVVEGQPQNNEWVGTKIMFRPAFSGYRALYLLLAESPEFIDGLSADTWRKWAAVIVSYPLNSHGGDEMAPHQHLAKQAYMHAPEEVIQTLLQQVDAENEKGEYIMFPQRLDSCWDDAFKRELRNKLNDDALKTDSWGRILEELLEHGDAATQEIAERVLISFVAREVEKERALLAGASLMGHGEGDGWWSLVWAAIKSDADFGRALVESVPFQTRPASKLKESEVAEFYLWLVKIFPPSEDPEIPMGQGFVVGTRMEITEWRNSFLNDLKQRGTPESLAALEQIAAASPELKKQLHWILIEARENVRRHTWKPLTPSALLKLLKQEAAEAKSETKPAILRY